MRKGDGQRYFRKLRCEGCYRHCRYLDFRPLGGGKAAFGETLQGLRVNTDAREQWRYKRRGTVLGMMHAEKMAAWEAMTNACPVWGARLEVGNLVRWPTKGGKELEGVVVAEVPAGETGEEALLALRMKGEKLHSRILGGSPPRSELSYLVAAQLDGRRQRSVMWPNSRCLELVQP